jgi:hypothetical protein
MGNAPLEAYEQSQQDLLDASRKFYYDTLKCIGKTTVDDEVLKSLRKTSQNCLWENPDKISKQKPCPGLHGLSEKMLSGSKVAKGEGFQVIPNIFWQNPDQDYCSILHVLARKGKFFHFKKILDAYQLLCISHVRATVAEEIKKGIRDAIYADVIARKSEEFRDEIRVSMEKEILQKVEERIREEKTRLEKIMLPREGKQHL